jgi:hypothetical protein
VAEAAVAALPCAAGLAVHAPGGGRVLPWPVARGLLADPGLELHTSACGELSPWEGERLLAALVAGDVTATRLLVGPWPPSREAVRELPRHPRTWARTVDAGVIVGDLDAACCRSGLALPGDDPLRAVAAIALLMERGRGELAVRRRLLADHPWIADAAWMSATGLLAEMVVLQGLRRDQVRREIAPATLPVCELLAEPERFRATRPDAQAAMRAILDGEVRWNERGHLALRPVGGWHHQVGGVELTCGVGGLHSTDRPGVIDGPLLDLDVASYYPSIIAGDALAPPQLPDFAKRVGTLMARRLAAKRAGDKVAANALKLVINSLYGQLGNARSGLFSPPDALRVVLTGQLRLLELIDDVLAAGGSLISANTDGVMVRGPVEAVAQAWEARTGFALERTPYARLWRTSVNDYIAVTPDGQVAKAKGRFAGGDDAQAVRRAAAPIVARAAVAHLVHGQAIAEVLGACTTSTDFALWRHARDLLWDGQPLHGSVVRWVVGRGGRSIVQSADGRSQVTVAANAILLPDPQAVAPEAIDRAWYAREVQDLVDRVLGTAQGTRQMSLFV